jgi:hypothetical protein
VALLAIKMDVREEVRPWSDFAAVFPFVASPSFAVNEGNRCFVEEGSKKFSRFVTCGMRSFGLLFVRADFEV